MIEKLSPISIGDIFSSINKYKIPIYQRNFAWGEKEIFQLIEDIKDNDFGWFLGNLIVDDKNDNEFEVIDGQQRLTTLFIIYKYLQKEDSKIIINMELTFECRDSSNELLKKLGEKNEDNAIINGYNIVKYKFESDNINQKKFLEKLNKATLLRIPVPEKTDLNHYFEIMNTRGEQLEKVDILKANLMEKLAKEGKEMEFSKIWDACSNMNEYVIKNLKHNEQIFDKYFKNEDGEFKWNNENKELNTYKDDKSNEEIIPLCSLLQDFNTKIPKFVEDNSQTEGHFETLVQFPEFLLHVLNITENDKNISPDKEGLLESFKNKPDPENFIINLLKYRFFYDTYIGKVKIKLENDSNKEEVEKEDKDNTGIFDIRKIKQGKDSIYPVKTFNNNDDGKNIRAVQWALRITHTSQKAMEWITEALKFINSNYSKQTFEKEYLSKLEQLVISYVKNTDVIAENNKINQNIINNGVSTPHIIFAYLDYLLQKDTPVESDHYYYNFRTSVEHLYPRKDTEVKQELQNKEKLLNNFGNLFLISRKTNSKFSNLPPEAKWEIMSEGMPPKLEKAHECYKENGKWVDTEIEKHCEEMIDILEKELTK